MNNSDEIAYLLRETVAASNRTTRAVRAFVRFLFIQLSAATFAGLVMYFGVASANVALVVVGLVIWLAGVLWSSSAGWEELDKSDPDKFENRARTASEMEEIRISEQKRIDEFNKAEATRLLILEKQQADAVAEAEKRRAERRALRSALFKKPWFRISVGAVSLLIVALIVFNQAIADSLRSESERAAIANEALRVTELESSVRQLQSAIDDCGSHTVGPLLGEGVVKINTVDKSFLACVVDNLTGADFSTLSMYPGSAPKSINGYELKILGSWLTITTK